MQGQSIGILNNNPSSNKAGIASGENRSAHSAATRPKSGNPAGRENISNNAKMISHQTSRQGAVSKISLEVAGLDGSQSVKNIFSSTKNTQGDVIEQNVFKQANEWPPDVDTARKEDYQ